MVSCEDYCLFQWSYAAFSYLLQLQIGVVNAHAYNSITDAIRKEVSNGCDAILLDLHGAMIAEGAPDGEGLLLESIRKIAPNIPMGVALDLHGNVTQKMTDNCDVMISLKTYPHIDMYDTGKHVGNLIKNMLFKTLKPVMLYKQLPLLSHTLRSNTQEGSMKEAVELAKNYETRENIVAVSVVAGFSLADFHDAGMTLIVITNQSLELARTVIKELNDVVWQQRDGFVYESRPLMESLELAKELHSQAEGNGPVLLLDHSDNVMSGGSCDTTDILEALVDSGIVPGYAVACGPYCDPETVEQLVEVGIGNCDTIHLGNKSGWLVDGMPKSPLMLHGTVRSIVNGTFQVKGPIFTGQTADMGKTVLFETESGVEIIISSDRMEPYDTQVYSITDCQFHEKDFLLLKSRVYCRPIFCPFSKGLVECDSDQGGPTSSNYKYFSFKYIRKSVYPLYK